MKRGVAQRGQALVEFLFSVLLLLITVFASVQLMLLVYAYVVMAEGAKAGVRYAVVHGANSGIPSAQGSDAAVKNEVLKYANFISATDITVTYEAGSNAPPNYVRVVVNYPFNFLSLGWASPTIRAAAQGRIIF